MDITLLDKEVHKYCEFGLAPPTNKVYVTAMRNFSAFCIKLHIIQPFPVNELILCRCIAALAREGIAPAKMKTYLAGIRHTKIMRGQPVPSQPGSLPRLKLVQAGAIMSIECDNQSNRAVGSGCLSQLRFSVD